MSKIIFRKRAHPRFKQNMTFDKRLRSSGFLIVESHIFFWKKAVWKLCFESLQAKFNCLVPKELTSFGQKLNKGLNHQALKLFGTSCNGAEAANLYKESYITLKHLNLFLCLLIVC